MKNIISFFILFFIYYTYSFGINNLKEFIDLNYVIKLKNVEIKKVFPEDNHFQWVITLPKGTVINEGGILTQEGFILKDIATSNGDQHRLTRGNRDINTENPMYFEGRLAVISSPGSENWYHWLLQVIPRLIILEESEIQYDRIYINNLKYPWQMDSLNAVLNHLKIPDDKLLIINGDIIVQASQLIVPSVPFIPCNQVDSKLPNWLTQKLRTIFLGPNFSKVQMCNRIYISRANAGCRRIKNEETLCGELKKLGFEILCLESLSPFDQAKAFNNAKVIVGPHGSGFANLIFASKGCRLFEIDHGTEPIRSFYKRMTSLMDCQYYPFYVDNTTEEYLDEDIEVNIPLFIQFLKENLN